MKSLERALPYATRSQNISVFLILCTLHYSRKQKLVLSDFLRNLFSPFSLISICGAIATLYVSQLLENQGRFFDAFLLTIIWTIGWLVITFTLIKQKKINLHDRILA
jgi:predicted membrane channel-forming protein YqfA (hemolysin III family)